MTSHRDVAAGAPGIIEALEARNTELAEKRAREHTLGLAAYVEAHGARTVRLSALLAEDDESSEHERSGRKRNVRN